MPIPLTVRAGLAPAALGKGVGVDPLYNLFTSGESGFLFDPGQLDGVVKDNRGAVLVSTDGDGVWGLLDRRTWAGKTFAAIMALQSDIILNGGFDTGASWTPGTGWSIGSGVATKSVSGGPGSLAHTVAGANGGLYQHIYDIIGGLTGVSAGNMGAGDGAYRSVAGNNVADFLRCNGSAPSFFGSAGNTQIIDNVRAKRIPGNFCYQDTAASRPLYKTNSGKPYLDYDGSNDILVSGFVPGAAITMAVAFNTATANAILIGGGDSAGNRRCFLGLNGNGWIGGGWGSNSFAAIYADTGDLRNTDHVAVMAADGTSVDIFLDGVLVHSSTPSGSPTGTTSPVAVGALNNGGSPTSFSDCRIYGQPLALGRRATGKPANVGEQATGEIASITRQLKRTYQ